MEKEIKSSLYMAKCPHCGSKPKAILFQTSVSSVTLHVAGKLKKVGEYHYVKCINEVCDRKASKNGMTEQEAVDEWNKYVESELANFANGTRGLKPYTWTNGQFWRDMDRLGKENYEEDNKRLLEKYGIDREGERLERLRKAGIDA